MDEHDEINLAVVSTDYEQERDPNIDDTPSKKSNFGGLLIKFFIGVILWRLILEIISICV